MKSRLIKIEDMASVEMPQELLTAEVTQEQIEQAVLRTRQQYQTIETVSDCVADGDFVVLEINGENRCYNTARNFVCRELVAASVGHRAGDRITAQDGTTGTVVSVKRKILPPFDDALAQKAGEASAAALLDRLTAELTAKRQKEAERKAVGYLTGQVLDGSEYDLCEAEIAEQYEKMKQEFEQMAEEQDIPLMELVTDFLPMYEIEETSGSTAEDYLRRICEKQLKIILLGSEYLREYHVTLGREQYEKEISRIAKEAGGSQEEIENYYSMWAFLYEKCNAQVENAARKYIRNRNQIRIIVEK